MFVRQIEPNLFSKSSCPAFKGISGNGYIKNFAKERKFIDSELSRIEQLHSSKLDEIRYETDPALAQQKIKELDIIKNAYTVLYEKVKRLIPKPPLDIQYTEGKGFGRIAGYDDIKTQLNRLFFNQLSDEKNGAKVDIPNAFIFFGPYGTGKSTFARALSEQMELQPEIKSNLIEINGIRKDSEKLQFVENLKQIVQKAKEDYDKKGRTVIYIDEFTENNLSSNPKAGEMFSDLLSNLSEKYKCTAFLTTNHLSKHGLNLSKVNPVYVGLELPNTKNAAAVMEYYIKNNGLESSQIDYKKLAAEILEYENKKGNYLNNTNLYNIADGVTNKFSKRVGYDEIMKYVKNKYEDDFITQKELDEFKSDVLITSKDASKAIS